MTLRKLYLTGGLVLIILLFSILSYPLDLSKPWHTLQQIAISESNLISIDQNNDGKIDYNVLDIRETLQTVTDRGPTTTKTINVGGLNSDGSVIISGETTIKGTTNLQKEDNTLLIGCTTNRCWTNANGIIGFPGFGVSHGQIAYYPEKRAFAFIDSSNAGPAQDYGPLESITKFSNIYAGNAYFTGTYNQKATGDNLFHIGDSEGNDLYIDVAGGQGLVNLVAGAKVKEGTDSYIFTGTRGASRITLHDNYIAFYVSTSRGTPGSGVTWKSTLAVYSNGNIQFHNLKNCPRLYTDDNGVVKCGGNNVLSTSRQECYKITTINSGWTTRWCNEGYFVAAMQISMSDQWSMWCCRVVSKIS